MLVFLPGVREIEATLHEIRPFCDRHGYDALPLHGSLTKDEQDDAVRGDSLRPRVICATNIAETSLTLPRVRLVIDSGLVRRAGHDPGRGVDTLETARISKASAEQRAGRAGRVAAGRCLRLWSPMTHRTLADFDVPEVRRADVSRAILSISAWGGSPASFGWFEAPDPTRLDAATRLLDRLGAIRDGRITPLGQALQKLPLPPRIATLLTLAPAHLRDDAVTLAALLGEAADVPGRRTANVHDLLDAYARRRLDATTDRAVRRAAEALRRVRPSHPPAEVDMLETLLIRAYPDRVCRRRSSDTATMANGGGVHLAEPADVRGDWFLALDARRGSFARAQQADVRLVAEVDPAWLDTTTATTLEWTGEEVAAVRRKSYGELVLDEQRGGDIDADAAADLLRNRLRPELDSLLNSDDATTVLRRRHAMLQAQLPTHLRPTGGDINIADVLEDAVAAALVARKFSRRAVADRLADAYRNRLLAGGWHRALDEHAPTHLDVPSGSRIKLDWIASDAEAARGPVLAVRLQELFGLATTPRICGGRVPVTLQLLAPNMRPQQVTDDLASFWANTYPQVRKDLRARYPKHRWPDDPLTAEAIRGTGRRRT